MPARRQIFGTQYGSAKMEQARGKGNIPPAMTKAPVPLSLAGAPNQGGAPGQAPMPQNPAAQPGGEANGAGGAPFPPDMEQLLQRLLAQFGGANG